MEQNKAATAEPNTQGPARTFRQLADDGWAGLLAGGTLHPSWAAALAEESPALGAVVRWLAGQEESGARILPPAPALFTAFRRPLDEVRVLIVGQDPYPTPGHAMGLSFSVAPDCHPVPRSLQNIFKELHTDLGLDTPAHGDLSRWADQGVLLLNRVLSVEAGNAGSHRGHGWEEFTTAAIRAVVARRTPEGRRPPLVAILWGRDAAGVAPLLEGCPAVRSPHPSPLSASRGFFGSRPFSQVNELLAQQGAAPVDWSL
ncbi:MULTISPECIES: uracil-DNA glycosylase [Arthrobacter]|uniref:Uracil-DNA glycosylase n=2 Tax=Arthrobacter TaxID=1663 RepID=A0ABU9KLI7_9MICC|nr:uracil-DNA glycosylase [Arthrobacter sp. YJM1]MDP5227766.1 uracil-DNA glycosylase [Arthrobacter sp. YJM1]